MKTNSVLKIGISLVLIALLGLVSLKSFSQHTKDNAMKIEDNVTVTLDSNTTSKEFEDIKNMLKENQITVVFSEIKRNDLNQLTQIKIELKDENGNKAMSQTSSTEPISQITFGRKDGLLFISHGNMDIGALALLNRPNSFALPFQNDSIQGMENDWFKNFNFDDFFNADHDNFFFDGKSLSVDELKEQLKKQFEMYGNGSPNLSPNSDSNNRVKSHKRFTFIDDPNTEKIIIIDGKESDFDTLKKLSESDQLDAVDVLGSETAVSIYGKKAKDGAIIATKKH